MHKKQKGRSKKDTAFPLVTRAVEDMKIVQRETYAYLISPLESISQPVDPKLLLEIAEMSIAQGVLRNITCIVAIEAMSIHLGTTLSIVTGIPLYIARKKKHALAPRLAYTVRNNYEEVTYYLYGSFSGMNVLVVDDVISSGNTLRETVLHLRKLGAIVSRALIVVGRGKKYMKRIRSLGLEVIILNNVTI